MRFKIYLSSSNSAATNVDCAHDGFATHQAEEEVLLLPNFCFQVSDIYTSTTKHKVPMKQKNSANAD